MRWSLIALLLLGTRLASAADVGEVAVIPDPGNVLSAVSLPTATYVQRAACAFYQTHEDRYDALFIFTNHTLNAFNRSQQGWAVKSSARGIGLNGWPDSSARYCSTRLRHALKLSDIGAYPDDPDAPYTAVPGFTLTGTQLMGHELGHQWMAGVRFLDGTGRQRCLLRGFTGDQEATGECDGYSVSAFNLHWSFYLNSGSVMYGNEIRDLGGGRFELSSPSPKYSPLDQYLMGIRPAAEVPPMFLVDNGPPSAESTEFPLAPGQTRIIEGERLDFTIQDVIRAEGPRIPSSEPCHWKAAFILVHDPAEPPTAAEIARVDRYRARFESFYADATDRRGSFDTTLAGAGPGTPECPAVGEPVRDAGFALPDAAAADALPTSADAGGPDLDAGPLEDAQASGTGPPPEPGPSEPRVLGLADSCACQDHGGPSGPGFGLLLLVWGAWPWPRPRRSSSRRS